jgi:RimJ/RimL family protein N-acetyltransferase
MNLPIETERLLLRRFRDQDLEPFLAYRNDPGVARYQGWSIPYARESALAFVEEMKNAQMVPGQWLQLAIEVRETTQMAGDAAIHIMKSDPRQAYLGVTLARDHWGLGYANEAMRKIIDLLFAEDNLHRLVAECDVENTASWQALERLGFRREAHLVENIFFKGAYGSEYHYALLQREWMKR